MTQQQNRRQFVSGLSSLGLLGIAGGRGARAGEATPETSSVRFANAPGLCISPQYVAEQLLRAEGFHDFSYVETDSGIAASEKMARGELDFSVDFNISFIAPADGDAPIKVLAGLHTGCYELFAHQGIGSVLDLKGKKVGAGYALRSDPHVFVSAMAAYVGLDPARDIEWVAGEDKPLELFADGKIDAFLSFAPEAAKLRDMKIGHVVVDAAVDKPWSQYFCCMVGANADYVARYPVATKRVVRALLKAADLCVSDPRRVAERYVEMGYSEDAEAATRSLRDIRYNTWREFDPEDTLRFFSLRMRESGIVTSSPEEIVGRLADWRFLDEIRQELKT